jgi:N-acetylmuramoyl-L-alanine amidase
MNSFAKIVLLAALWLSQFASAANLREVRLWEAPESTRVVFDLDAETRYQYLLVSDPPRIVLDIARTQKSPDFVANNTAKGVVKSVRTGVQADGSLRVVLDLTAPIKPKSFQTQPIGQHGHRIILDLDSPRKEEKPEAAAGILEPAKAESAVMRPLTMSGTLTTLTLVKAPPASRSTAAGTQAVKPPLVQPLPPKPIPKGAKLLVIVIDPGHGGEDPGTRGASLVEKDLMLVLGKKLAKQINTVPGMRAVLTRDGDYFVPLRERLRRTRAAKADLLISLHANSFRDKTMRGSAVYVVSKTGATDEQAKLLANLENAADQVGGVEITKDDDLAALLIDVSQAATLEASFDVGARLLGSLGKLHPLQKRDVQQAGFAVLKAPDIPSVLVETAFLTNETDEKNLNDPTFQDQFVIAMTNAVQSYFESYRPSKTQHWAGRALEVHLSKLP